jgi:hypothetical protein
MVNLLFSVCFAFMYFKCVSFISKYFYFSVSSFTKGEQMVPVLDECGTHCAVFGNHDFGKIYLRGHWCV